MRIRRQLTVTLALLLTTIAIAGACGAGGTADLLDTVKSKGKLVVVDPPIRHSPSKCRTAPCRASTLMSPTKWPSAWA